MNWSQPAMFGNIPVEITLRIGVFAPADLLSIEIEVRNADDGDLIALWSKPITRLIDTERAMDEAMKEVWHHIDANRDPFPDAVPGLR